ncbi:ABC transporter permease [Micrococcus flavus]|uniref:Iron complex transport system permease protein n=1 Tax=Micrococcus flavus TaxID=384602 RepID=A0A4Y8X4U5_9MICC|nr:iron chelate uptake ABC transporter family permease subunit [Micrococcus flavus]MBB4882202.1 iron complex transport system permease protein [Micrococcus flavus]TFI03875.1 ABC transporter permease [Micrococcus flavus]GGK51101.1 iron ABC transporter permease [Micrococcus flavus]
MTDLRPGAAARTPLTEPGPGERVCWVPPAVLRPQRTRWQRTWPLLVGLAVTVGLVVLSLNVGAFDLGTEGGTEMFWITRVPRTVALVLAGAALALCGLIMQLMTQNRFVEPSTTGTTEWAGLGLLTTMILIPGAGIVTRMVGAVLFAFVGTMVFFLFLRRVRLSSSLIVPIVGIMLGAVVGAASTFLALQTDMLQQLGAWFAGSFTSVVRGRYELLFLVLAVTVAVFLIADRFTVAGLGKDIATNVGLNYEAVVFTGVAMVSVATGVITVVIGALPFLGLVVPNLVSMIRGDNLRTNLPWVVMAGVWTVIVCDVLGRTLIAPFEIPISLILALVGAAVFLTLLLGQARRG